MDKFIYLRSTVRHHVAIINYLKPVLFWRILGEIVQEIITPSKVKAHWGDSHSISAFHVGYPYCLKGHSAGLGWNRAKFLYSSWHRAVFGFVLKTGWKRRGCFCYCWAGFRQSQWLFFFLYCHTGEQAGGSKELGDSTIGRADTWSLKQYPF